MDIEQLKADMQRYFREQKNLMQQRAKEYSANGQQREAEMEMNRLDVYDTFGTMLEACALKATLNPKFAGQDRTKVFCQEYLMTFISKPAEWRKSYTIAKERGEAQEIRLEELRLSTVQEIRNEFLRISRESEKKG
ncbi:MAG: hypothetical protein K2N94_12200 [Lachnospiraceae bacterium]|nr:hypothetical protein [Lachnospiraceae bacterium]